MFDLKRKMTRRTDLIYFKSLDDITIPDCNRMPAAILQNPILQCRVFLAADWKDQAAKFRICFEHTRFICHTVTSFLISRAEDRSNWTSGQFQTQTPYSRYLPSCFQPGQILPS